MRHGRHTALRAAPFQGCHDRGFVRDHAAPIEATEASTRSEFFIEKVCEHSSGCGEPLTADEARMGRVERGTGATEAVVQTASTGHDADTEDWLRAKGHGCVHAPPPSGGPPRPAGPRWSEPSIGVAGEPIVALSQLTTPPRSIGEDASLAVPRVFRECRCLPVAERDHRIVASRDEDDQVWVISVARVTQASRVASTSSHDPQSLA